MDSAVFNLTDVRGARRRRGGRRRLAALLIAAIRGFPAKPDRRPSATAGDVIKFLSTRRRGRDRSSAPWCWPRRRWPTAAIAVRGPGLLLEPAVRRAAPPSAPRWPGWRRWPAGPRACATPSPARSAWSRRSRPPPAPPSPAIRENLHTLVDRLRARMPLPQALEYFADDMDDASADLVIAALILNARLRGPGLREVLGALAQSSREEVDMRQRVDGAAQLDPAQRADRGRGVGRDGAGPGDLQQVLRRSPTAR